jgi:hypothetical protein
LQSVVIVGSLGDRGSGSGGGSGGGPSAGDVAAEKHISALRLKLGTEVWLLKPYSCG